MKIKSLLFLNFLIPSLLLLGQSDDSDDSEDSSAEASVVSSASVASVASDGATESNPIVALVRAGIPFTVAASTDFGTARKMAKGGVETFRAFANSIKAGKSIDDVLTLIDTLGYDFDTDKIDDLLEDVKSFSNDENAKERLQQAGELIRSFIEESSLSESISYNLSTLINDKTTIELLNLLNSYGAFGDNGDKLIGLLNNPNFENISAYSTANSNLINNLSIFTGERGFATENLDDSILDLPLDHVTLSPSGKTSISSETTISLDKLGVLSAVEVNGDYDASPSDEFVHIFAAVGDLTVTDDLTITNTNDAEDHALVLASSDNVTVKGADITYTGSNLAIAGADSTSDSVWLANTKITAGGNLAVASLGTINIGSANFVVGNANSETSDPDNVYLYANDLISATNLSFTGSRLDDVYMEAVTLNLTNIDFPASAEVMLRSRDGTLNFNASKIEVGSVNLNNVKHLGISDQALSEDNFNISKGAGHIDSFSKFENGSPMMRIRAQNPTMSSATN